jgi:uncharacterized protein (DUF1015 family)
LAELRPLKPLLYDPAVVGDLSAVLTPPYDVIYPEQREMYRNQSPHSAVHIELPVSPDGGDPYDEAARTLGEWRASGALRPHDEPAYFVHRQEYELDGVTRARTALLAGVRLEPWDARVVLPHETTFAGPKQDRLSLLRATAVAPSSIFSLYEQPRSVAEVVARATEGSPLLAATSDGVRHGLWAIADEGDIATVAVATRDFQIYIADGHHRYETALAYRDERRAAGAGEDAASECVAMSLVAFDDPGLVVLPTHRLVANIPPEAVRGLEEGLRGAFELAPVELSERTERGVARLLEGDEPYLFLLYNGGRLWRVSGGPGVADRLPAGRSEAWRRLDLAALHELVFARALGVPPERTQEHVRYTRDVPGALTQVDSGQAQVAAFVRPTGVGQLRAVADAADKMPQKSTYFYPKFPAGLVINRLDVTLPAPLEVAR